MPSSLVEDRPDRVQAVESAFELLEIILDAGGEASLSELAAASELPPPALRRLLRTCLRAGCIHHLPSQRYGLGARLVRLGEEAIWQIQPVARPRLVELVRLLGESAGVELRDGDKIICVAQQPSRQVMRTVTEVGSSSQLHSTAAGKAMLATMSNREVRRIITGTGWVTSTPNAHRSIRSLLADLAAVRRRGYAVDNEEQELGARSYAVAIPHARTLMAVSVSGPISRVDDAFGERAVPILQQISVQLSHDLAA